MPQVKLDKDQSRIDACKTFAEWIENAKPRQVCTYYTGYYLHESLSGVQLQKMAYRLSQNGLIYLVQMRHRKGDTKFEYLAIRASKEPVEKLLPYKVYDEPKLRQMELVNA